MSTLGRILDRLTPDGDAFTIVTPDEWAQGRTLYGGMTAALAYAAVTRAHPGLPPLRSAQFTFVGPATGALRLRPQLLRQGRSATLIALDCTTAEGFAARAMFAFGAARDSAVTHDRTPRPDVPPPDACERFHKSARPLPGFLARYEFRLAGGTRLFEPGQPPAFAVWVRPVDPPHADPVATLLAIADALPAAAMANFPKPAPVSTMTWGVDLHGTTGAGEGWHLVTSESESAADGYSRQAMRVHDAAGVPLLTARQVVAVFA